MIITIAKADSRGYWDPMQCGVQFSYDPDLVATIKSLPRYSRSWNPDIKCWIIDTGQLDNLARLFTRDGHTVMVDGVEWQPPQRQQRSSRPPPKDPPPPSNVFVTLLGEMPGHLRQPAYKALSKVLHPDIGGDKVLMQKLNAAWQVYERSAG